MMQSQGELPPNYIPPAGDTGPIQGIQSSATWAGGAPADQRPLLDITRAESLWQCSVDGSVRVFIRWGTKGGTRSIEVDAPCVFTVPGQVTVWATPRTDPVPPEGVQANVTCTPAFGGCCHELRNFLEVVGPSIVLNQQATSYFALLASTVLIRGVAVAVAAGTRIPLVNGSVLTAGVGYEEFVI